MNSSHLSSLIFIAEQAAGTSPPSAAPLSRVSSAHFSMAASSKLLSLHRNLAMPCAMSDSEGRAAAGDNQAAGGAQALGQDVWEEMVLSGFEQPLQVICLAVGICLNMSGDK